MSNKTNSNAYLFKTEMRLKPNNEQEVFNEVGGK